MWNNDIHGLAANACANHAKEKVRISIFIKKKWVVIHPVGFPPAFPHPALEHHVCNRYDEKVLTTQKNK